MEKMKLWLSAIRLRTLPLSVSGIIIGACLAEYNGFFNIKIFILALLTTLSFQILSNLANDYGDGIKGTDNNNRVGPERAIQSGKISKDQMFKAIRFMILISIGLSFSLIFYAFGVYNFLYSILFFVLAIISIYASIRYTVGNSAYGYKGLGDLFVFIFFGLVSVIGSYFLFAKQFDHVVILPSIIVGLLSTAVLNLNNMRDMESDKVSGKITFAIILGHHKVRVYHYFLVGGAIFTGIVFSILYFTSLYNFLFYIAFVPLVMHLIKVSKVVDLKILDPELKKLALSTFILSLLLALGQIL